MYGVDIKKKDISVANVEIYVKCVQAIQGKANAGCKNKYCCKNV